MSPSGIALVVLLWESEMQTTDTGWDVDGIGGRRRELHRVCRVRIRVLMGEVRICSASEGASKTSLDDQGRLIAANLVLYF